MGIFHFASAWKPTINSVGVGGVNKKRMGQKQKDTRQKNGLVQPLMRFPNSLILLFDIPKMIPIKSILKRTLCC